MKEARSNKTNNKAKQHSIPRGISKAFTFPKKNELHGVGFKPTTLYTLDKALYQLSYRWLGPNLTSHSAPDERAYYQLSPVMKPPMTPNTKPSIYMFNEKH